MKLIFFSQQLNSSARKGIPLLMVPNSYRHSRIPTCSPSLVDHLAVA